MAEQALGVPQLVMRALRDRELKEEPLVGRRRRSSRVINMRWRMFINDADRGRSLTFNMR
jgi:hypothetical protein